MYFLFFLGLADDHPHLLLALLLPNHPSWTSVPKKVNPIQKEFDIPDDIFSSLLEDVDNDDMAEEELSHTGLLPIGETPDMGEIGMQELISILGVRLNNNFQNMTGEDQNNNPNIIFPGQQNFTPEINHFWPTFNIAPNLQPSNTFGGNLPAMFDPLAMYGPPNFCPFQQ